MIHWEGSRVVYIATCNNYNCRKEKTLRPGIKFYEIDEFLIKNDWIVSCINNDWKHFCCKECQKEAE